jgi:hypothetical protein
MAATGRYTNRLPTQTMGADDRIPIPQRFMDALQQALEPEMTMLRVQRARGGPGRVARYRTRYLGCGASLAAAS